MLKPKPTVAQGRVGILSWNENSNFLMWKYVCQFFGTDFSSCGSCNPKWCYFLLATDARCGWIGKKHSTNTCLITGKMDQVYHSLLSLARYFEETGDQWLSDHFYASLLKTSLKIRGDGRRKESEANCNMGLALERKGTGGRIFALALLISFPVVSNFCFHIHPYLNSFYSERIPYLLWDIQHPSLF